MNEPIDYTIVASLCDRFERDWASGDPPALEAFLGEAERSNRGKLLIELLQVELWRRRNESPPPSIDFYLERFPEWEREISEGFRRFRERTQDDLSPTCDARGEPSHKLADTVSQEAVEIPTGKSTSLSYGDRLPSNSPRTIGRYTVVGTLGRGGQGAVYRAVHPNLPIELAIKVGCRQVSDVMREAMLEEARVLCDLNHPNIAKIRDLEVDESGHPILVLDLIRGRSLQQLLNDGEVTTGAATEWLADVARAVGYAHRRGVLHLDLKPGNIVIDENGQAKVIDFGLARSRDAWSDPTEEVDGISGTPDYMPPEQATGIAEKINARSDIFALGAILYRILTGVSPFHAATPQRAILRSRQYDLDIDALGKSEAPVSVVEACRRAIAREPAERFTTAEEFAAAIARKTDADEAGQSSAAEQKTASVSFGFFGITLKLAVTLSVLVVGSVALLQMTRQVNQAASHSIDSMTGGAVASPDGRSSTAASLPTEEQVLQGDIHLSVIRDGKLIPIEDSTARPLRPGDGIRVEAQLNRPAYLYLVWIDETGQAQPFFPGLPGDWSEMSVADEPEDFVVLPQASEGYTMEGESGMQTILLLARETPFSESQDLGELFAGLPYQTLQDPRALVYLDQGNLSKRSDRAPNFFQTAKVDDPVLQTQDILSKRLKKHFPLIRSVSVALKSEAKR